MLIHPGEMIKDEIVARGLTQKELAKQMGVSYTVFNEILNGKRPVTTEYALLLEAALGTNASIWIGLQADYNMQKAKQDKSFMKRLENIRKIAAVFCLRTEREHGNPHRARLHLQLSIFNLQSKKVLRLPRNCTAFGEQLYYSYCAKVPQLLSECTAVVG